MALDPRLTSRLACPTHGKQLTEVEDKLVCAAGHCYPVVDGIPVLLDERAELGWPAAASLFASNQDRLAWAADPYFLDTIALSDDHRSIIQQKLVAGDYTIAPVVSFKVLSTNGIAYRGLVGRLSAYPIPDSRLPAGNGKVLLDIGCGWGRWCLAAARKGYVPVGIEPSLGTVIAARRVARQLGLEALFVVGDACRLPFSSGAFEVIFSYSVLQHFSEPELHLSLAEVGRVLRASGRSVIQMPTTFGIRCLYHQVRRGFREARDFEVRYRTVPALRRLFNEHIGTTELSVDCFFGIGLQPADLHLMPKLYQLVIRASERLRKWSHTLPGLLYLADSVYLESFDSGKNHPKTVVTTLSSIDPSNAAINPRT